MAERARRAFVCGWPVAHSRSPLIHRYWLAEHDIDGSYDAVAVDPAGFDDFVGGLLEAGWAGGNVTIPHKERAVALAERRDAAAERIGAANTLWFENGRLHAANTDWSGFAANLDQGAPGWREGERAVVLGAGGAARAVIHALQIAGYRHIAIVNRTVERAQALAARFGDGVGVAPLENLGGLLADCDLLVNTTSLGMDGAPGHAFDLDRLGDRTIVTDIVYVPLVTPLLAQAAARGCVTVDGLGMLLHQAVPGFEAWFGVRPQVTDALRALVVADMEKNK
ncbi:MAG: shikimate dehydrogenase [Nitratireductor sp.]